MLTHPTHVLMVGIHGAGGVQVTVRLLGSSHNCQYAIYVLVHPFVGIGLHGVAGSFDGLVHIGVIEQQSFEFIILARMCRQFKIMITPGLLTLAEGKRYGHFTACLETLSPKRIGHTDRSEWDRSNGIAIVDL